MKNLEIRGENSRTGSAIFRRGTDEIVAAFAREDIGTGVSEAIARHPTVD